MFGSRRPNVRRLARKRRVDDLIEALRYSDWTLVRDGGRVDLGVVVRRDAVNALAASDDLRGIHAIADHSLRDADPEVRLTAVATLRAHVDPPVAAAMALAFVSCRVGYETVREAIAEALATASSLAAAPLARALIEREDSQPLDDREESLLRELAGTGEDAAEQLVAEFVAALAHDRAAPQERSVQALGALAPHSISALIEIISDKGRSRRVIEALGQCGDGRAVGPLIDLLADGDPAVRASAAQALGRLRDPRSADALFALSQDDSYEVRLAATVALDSLGSMGLLVGAANALRSVSRRGEASWSLMPGARWAIFSGRSKRRVSRSHLDAPKRPAPRWISRRSTDIEGNTRNTSSQTVPGLVRGLRELRWR